MPTGNHRAIVAAFLVCVFFATHTNAQFSQQGPKLVGTGAIGNANQGSSVAVSEDGNTLVIGGPADNNNVGAVWVWVKSGGQWVQQGPKLVGTGAVGVSGGEAANQGWSVAVSADGNTILVGGPTDYSAGAVWVFTRSASVWTQQGPKLVGSDAVGFTGQGSSVALSSDGNTAIVGGADYNSSGAAWVWTRAGGVWTQQGPKLTGAGVSASGLQMASVDLSADGNTAIVGGWNDMSRAGAAWIWTRSGGVWSLQSNRLVGSGAVDPALQGHAVAIAANGTTALVGGWNDNSRIGATWVWTRNGSSWTQQGAKLVGSGGVGDTEQGLSVSLSADGSSAIIGGSLDNNGIGSAWIWTRNAGVWTQLGSKLVGSGATGSSFQGRSVSMAADGRTVAVGGGVDNNGIGAVWVFNSTQTNSIAPTITTQPQNRSVVVGSDTTFTVGVDGTPAPTLQWQISTNGGTTFSNLSNTTPYSGVTTQTLAITAASSTLNGALFRAVASNSAGSATSAGASLTVTTTPTLPTITSQPQNQTVRAGAPATFALSASGATSYAWQVSTNAGLTWTALQDSGPYSGTRTPQMLVIAEAGFNGYLYRCMVSNGAGTVTSGAVTLGVTTNAGVPGAPTALAGSVVGATVTFSWTPPTTGGVATSYILEAGSAEGQNNIANVPLPDATTFSASGVPNGTYFIRLRAVNSTGTGPASNEMTLVVGPHLPGPPRALNASSTGTSIVLSWQAPNTGGAPTSYLIEAGSRTRLRDLAIVSTPNSVTTFSHSGVPVGDYYIRVKAVNNAGSSTASNEAVLRVRVRPPNNPVVFIHGICAGNTTWSRTNAVVVARDWKSGGILTDPTAPQFNDEPKPDYYVIQFTDPDIRSGLEGWAVQLSVYLRHIAMRRHDQGLGEPQFTLVAHSAGGLAARTYMQSSWYSDDVWHLITYGTPHLGSPLSSFSLVLRYLPDNRCNDSSALAFSRGVREMDPDSQFLANLNRQRPQLAYYTSLVGEWADCGFSDCIVTTMSQDIRQIANPPSADRVAAFRVPGQNHLSETSDGASILFAIDRLPPPPLPR